MRIQVIAVPYDLGREGVGMGLGPARLLESGLATHLERQGHEVAVTSVHREAPFANEIAASFDVNRGLARAVAVAAAAGRFPLVLAGNCNSALGAISGIGPTDLGLVWFDAHGEFNTPDTTISGFLDGMPLAIATGRCWKAMAASIPGFSAVADERIVLIGARDIDKEERGTMAETGIALVPAEAVRQSGPGCLREPLNALACQVRRVYVHLDLDAIDPSEARSNAFASPNGLRVADVADVLQTIRDRFEIAAAAIASYDPASDQDGRAAAAAEELIGVLLATRGSSR